MRRDTLLSPGRLALPRFPPPPFTVSPGARPIISGMHGCGGWLGLVLYIGPGWGYGGGPRHGVGRCGLPFYQREGRSALVRAGPLSPAPGRAPTVTPHGLGFERLAQLDTFPPTRWGNGYKGTAATQFPHPD
eukprot:scaffold16967_cov113-Isochrysis_galbana.AAC.1